MSNFYKDNKDLQFTLENIDLVEAVGLKEENYTKAEKFDTAPLNYKDALDNYIRLADVVGEICGENIAPRSTIVDEVGPHFENGVVTYHELTQKNLKELAQADVAGVTLPHEYGGLNFPATVYTMMTEMVSRADASLQNLFGLQDIAETICDFGNEEQRQEFLPRFARGEVDGSMDLTEPDFGSDLQSVRLRAWQDEKTGQWYLNGMKRFITNGCADVHLVLARSEEGTSDGRGLSMFIAEKCPQLVVRRIENKLGIHGVATCELQYNDVPAQLCGKRRFGLIKYVMSLMNGARVAISAQAVGIAEAAYREAKKYASERMQFKKSIDQFPAIYDMLASMKVKVTAARTLLYETTRAVDLRSAYNALAEKQALTAEEKAKQKYYNKVAAVLTPMCKALATEISNQVAYDAIQIHGGTGYMKDFPVERYYRDARITNIYEGTTQLQIVAAIGGVIQRDNTERINELLALPFEGRLARLAEKVKGMLAKQEEAVAFVANKKDPVYHDLMARSLVENETYVFVGLLMLRDALKCADREVLAERYIIDGEFEFEKRYLRIMSDDKTVIDNHRDVINY
ncbi:MAG: acyl-CoA dehydrogenase family protein [Lentisphaeria bacterium]|nr:acyl-CoA dehydrogenase family protein [Lentisphaeria bacterium]